jgi:hypothetical protein
MQRPSWADTGKTEFGRNFSAELNAKCDYNSSNSLRNETSTGIHILNYENGDYIHLLSDTAQNTAAQKYFN